MTPDPLDSAVCDDRRHAIRELIEQRIAHERELVQQQFLLSERALELHAQQTDRRMRDMEMWRVEAQKQLSSIATWGAAGALALTILSIILKFLPLGN